MLIVELSLLALLLTFSAFFSGSETAYFSLAESRIETLAQSDKAARRRVAKLIRRPADLLATLLLGNILVNVAAASLATMLTLRLFETGGLEYATLGMTFVLLILGEVTPKSLASYHPVDFATLGSRLLGFFRWLFTPIRKPLTRMTEGFTRRLVARTADDEELTLAELRTALELARQHGEVDEFESMLLGQIFTLEHKQVRQILTPVTEIVSIDVESKPAAALDVFRRKQFARLPVWEAEPDNWVGVVRAQDVGHAVLSGPPDDLRPLLRPITFIPEQASALTLLRHLRRSGSHLCLVNDEYGVLVGLVTLQDVYDELYESTPARESRIRQAEPGRWICRGSLGLDDFSRITGVEVTDDYYSSLGGHLTGLLGRIPGPGERINADGFTYYITEAEPTHIDRIVAQRFEEGGGSG